MLRLRGKPAGLFLADGSAIVTAWLIALTFPPLVPWWLIVVGTLFAIVVAKQLYGGLGQNPFNPAMIAFAVCIVAFPALMSQWPSAATESHFTDQLALIFGLSPRIDALRRRDAARRPENRTETRRRHRHGRRDPVRQGDLRRTRRPRLGMDRGRLLRRRTLAASAQGHPLACLVRLSRRHRADRHCALADRPGAFRQPAIPPALRRHAARRLLHRHRSGLRLHDGQGPADLRLFRRPARLSHSRFWRLPRRHRVFGAAAQSVRAADRHVYPTPIFGMRIDNAA